MMTQPGDAPPSVGDARPSVAGDAVGSAADAVGSGGRAGFRVPGWAVDGRAVRIAGGVVALALTVVTALVEIFYVPLRVGGVLVGASVLLAVLINFWLPRYTVALTGTGWVALLPPLIWFALMLLASVRRTEGDLLLAGDNWVGLATIFAGSLAFAAGGYTLLLRRD